jgi:hypothetical protein
VYIHQNVSETNVELKIEGGKQSESARGLKKKIDAIIWSAWRHSAVRWEWKVWRIFDDFYQFERQDFNLQTD